MRNVAWRLGRCGRIRMNATHAEIRPLPRLLYHYTTQRGLLGILGDKKLWATGIRHLNDSTEFEYALKLADEQLGPEKLSSVWGGRVNRWLEAVGEPFVASFSEQRDLLSQWRAYCHDEAGFSIGFEIEALGRISEREEMSLLRCIYDSSEHRNMIRNLLLTDPLRSSPLTDIESLSDVAWLAPMMKDEAFKQEEEWRLVSSSGKIIRPLYRAGQSFLIPYCEIDLRIKDIENSIIGEIVVGPTPHMQLSLDTVRQFLRDNSYKNVTVTPSRVPYRSW